MVMIEVLIIFHNSFLILKILIYEFKLFNKIF